MSEATIKPAMSLPPILRLPVELLTQIFEHARAAELFARSRARPLAPRPTPVLWRLCLVAKKINECATALLYREVRFHHGRGMGFLRTIFAHQSHAAAVRKIALDFVCSAYTIRTHSSRDGSDFALAKLAWDSGRFDLIFQLHDHEFHHMLGLVVLKNLHELEIQLTTSSRARHPSEFGSRDIEGPRIILDTLTGASPAGLQISDRLHTLTLKSQPGRGSVNQIAAVFTIPSLRTLRLIKLGKSPSDNNSLAKVVSRFAGTTGHVTSLSIQNCNFSKDDYNAIGQCVGLLVHLDLGDICGDTKLSAFDMDHEVVKASHVVEAFLPSAKSLTSLRFRHLERLRYSDATEALQQASGWGTTSAHVEGFLMGLYGPVNFTPFTSLRDLTTTASILFGTGIDGMQHWSGRNLPSTLERLVVFLPPWPGHPSLRLRADVRQMEQLPMACSTLGKARYCLPKLVVATLHFGDSTVTSRFRFHDLAQALFQAHPMKIRLVNAWCDVCGPSGSVEDMMRELRSFFEPMRCLDFGMFRHLE